MHATFTAAASLSKFKGDEAIGLLAKHTDVMQFIDIDFKPSCISSKCPYTMEATTTALNTWQSYFEAHVPKKVDLVKYAIKLLTNTADATLKHSKGGTVEDATVLQHWELSMRNKAHQAKLQLLKVSSSPYSVHSITEACLLLIC
jgi:hypothetical protein